MKQRNICFWPEDANHMATLIDWCQLRSISSYLSLVLCVIRPPLPWSPTFFPFPDHSCSEASISGQGKQTFVASPCPSGLCSQGPAPSCVQGQLSPPGPHTLSIPSDFPSFHPQKCCSHPWSWSSWASSLSCHSCHCSSSPSHLLGDLEHGPQ